MTESDFVVVRTYLNAIEAGFARSVLEAAGLDVYIHADDCGGVDPALQLSGVALLVRAADREEALRLLDTAATVLDPGAA